MTDTSLILLQEATEFAVHFILARMGGTWYGYYSSSGKLVIEIERYRV
ncbi:MAG: hypothetical protein LUH58_06715 [Lachnospiraceae bacterium]|nr:hypothetical protein [Lachnospiraceae bacterium]